MTTKPVYAEVILPLALEGSFTYIVPEGSESRAMPGMRVIVPVGKRKFYTGIIHKLHRTANPDLSLKEIEDFLDEHPLVREEQIKFWNWMSDYYLCYPGEIFKAALPSGLKLESETEFSVNQVFEPETLIRPEEARIFQFLKSKDSASLADIEAEIKVKGTRSLLKNLVEKAAVSVDEKLRSDYRPKSEIYLRLSKEGEKLFGSGSWKESFARSPKQEELLAFLGKYSMDQEKPVLQSLVFGSFSLNIVNGLYKKGLIEKFSKKSLRTHIYNGELREVFPLSPAQENAFELIRSGFKEKDVILLHGVTSSGKTEIYLHLIKEVINSGRQVLYLLPEIALTSQIVSRIEEVFGDQIAVYHSKFSDSERVDVYLGLLREKEKEKKLILGVRSAVFLPFRDLGLIIVDEEHENTYKQYDPAPRYHARDSAIVLGSIYGAKTLLGTATPSIETYLNCKSGKYGLVELNERYGGVKLPEIRVVDIRKARLKNEMRSVFSHELITEMEHCLQNRKQVILFQNRRGYSPLLECDSCGWIPKCRSCDVSLTYHKGGSRLSCHYCGFSIPVPNQCHNCGSTRLATKGFGTELVEDELEMVLPGAKIARLDLDTTRSGRSHERILESFARKETDILVGTQMLSKGLDFENVSLVGILNADQMLNFPDFRAFERSFQLMSQVSGRAGRKRERGRVIIQTSDPGHPVIRQVLRHDFHSFYSDQVMERQEFRYPPFVRIIRILVKSREAGEGMKAANELSNMLRQAFGSRILGPQAPVVGRIKSWYLQQIILKVERNASFKKARGLLLQILQEAEANNLLKKVRINLDVDPL